MCSHCAKYYASEEVAEPTATALVDLIAQLYKSAPTGGPLHVSLDDWNLEDQFWVPFTEHHDYSPEIMTLATSIAAGMLALTLGQRAYVMAMWEKR